MQLYIVLGGILAVVFALGLAFVYGRKSGRESQRVGDLQRNADVRTKQLEEANKPRDPASVVDALRKGDF